MTNVLDIGTKSLISTQQALSTTGHNIANANTEGYSRQQVTMDSSNYRNFGFGYMGQGATIGSVDRVFDQFVSNQLNGFISSSSQYEVSVELNNRLNDLFADPQNSLNGSIQNLFSGLQEVSSNPSALASREMLIGEANSLVYRQQSVNNVLSSMNQDISNELRLSVDELNNQVKAISQLNKEIVSAIASANGAQPNDLLDQRDRMIRGLSEKIAVTSVTQPDGAVNVFVGNGQGLVIGNQHNLLEVRNNPHDASKVEIALEGQLDGTNISHFVKGGELQGMMDFRNRTLLQAQDALGLIVLNLTESFNDQHKLGLDMNGDSGQDFFAYDPVSLKPHLTNSGDSAPAITITDPQEIRASDYRLYYDGAQWEMTRLSDNTSVSGAGPLVLDGMSVDVSSGTPNTTDSFLFNPARDASKTFSMAIKDPRGIAAASALSKTEPATNSGSTSIENLTVSDASFIPLAADVEIEFSADALGAGVPGFTINGGVDGTFAYDPATDAGGKDISIVALGVTFTMSGTPGEGDSFTFANNTGATGDNGNIAMLGNLQSDKIVDGKVSTIQQFYGSMVAKIGIAARQANTNMQVESTLLEQAENYQLQVSGVNLDEEASNMIKYQQQYQAAAQVVKVATEMFQTLLNSIR